jgi:copper chaperone NosL
LNHYIGMKHISVDMFPEFKFLPYVVGFFMLLGMAVAITGNRKFLLAYLVLTVLGGALAMYDFYKWGYDYGHNLDPKAAIQVPGFSYQPPLFGHKRLLNFDAYSFPDVGGWIVIGAAMLAFGVWFVEWYRNRKVKIQNSKLPAVLTSSLLAGLIMISCTAKPEPFSYGKDNCYFCKMGIVDGKYGGEVITKKSKVYKFDDLVCMVRFLQSGTLKEEEIAQKVIINYEKVNDFLDVNKAVFWASPELRSPMGSNTAAFSSQQATEKAKVGKEGKLLSWDELYKKIQ